MDSYFTHASNELVGGGGAGCPSHCPLGVQIRREQFLKAITPMAETEAARTAGSKGGLGNLSSGTLVANHRTALDH